jgi:F0F1-type ATP synthase alpha subunit
MEQKHSNILSDIASKAKIDDDIKVELEKAINEFVTIFSAK